MDTRTLPEKWKLLFNSLLQSSHPNGASFEILASEEEIVFITPDQALAASLTSILNSPEAARASLNYSLTEEKSFALTALRKKHYPEPIKLDQHQGNTVFEKIFGDSIILRTGKMPWNVADLPTKDSFIAYFTCEKQYGKLSRHQVDTYQDILSSATFEELRRAIALDETQHSVVPLNLDQKGVLAKHIDKILQVRSEGDVDTIYFDYGLLITCLTAPEMQVTETVAHQFQIRLNKQHLINYLNLIFQEGFVLHITGKDDEQKALPICFNTKGSIPVDNVVSLILDISQSMEADFSDYIKHVYTFIKKLAENDSFLNARLRIVPFNEAHSLAEYFISNKKEDLDKIDKYLTSLKAKGGTHIYKALQTELTELIKLSVKNNITVLTFTDGDDNEDKLGKEKNITALKNVLEQMTHASHPARIFALGLGSNFSVENLRNLANASHGEFIKLNSIADFITIFDHLDKMGQARLLARFVQDLSETSFTVPVYANSISVAPQALKFPLAFSVGESRYDVKAGGLPLLEAADSKDNQVEADAETLELEALRLQIERQKLEYQRLLAARQTLFHKNATNTNASSATRESVPTHTLH
jgi:hypothetical protein